MEMSLVGLRRFLFSQNLRKKFPCFRSLSPGAYNFLLGLFRDATPQHCIRGPCGQWGVMGVIAAAAIPLGRVAPYRSFPDIVAGSGQPLRLWPTIFRNEMWFRVLALLGLLAAASHGT